MSLNWVMRTSGTEYPPFVLLENEQVKFSPPEIVDIKLKPLELKNPDTIGLKGKIYLTTHRVVVLSSGKTGRENNDSFALLYKDIQSHKLEMPWFGNNRYLILFKISNSDGGLNYLYPWSLVVDFTSGGAIRFAEEFSTIKTRFDNGQLVDELPAYTE